MTSLLSQFVRAATGTEPPADLPATPPVKQEMTKEVLGGKQKAGETRSLRVQARYAEVFATPTTVAKACAEMGLSHVGCLIQCYRYEKRGLIERFVERDLETGALLFQWIGPKT